MHGDYAKGAIEADSTACFLSAWCVCTLRYAWSRGPGNAVILRTTIDVPHDSMPICLGHWTAIAGLTENAERDEEAVEKVDVCVCVMLSFGVDSVNVPFQEPFLWYSQIHWMWPCMCDCRGSADWAKERVWIRIMTVKGKKEKGKW